MSAFHDLLVVQDHDSAADRLRHRRQTLPERAALAEVEAALASLDERLADARARRDEVARHQSRLEDEVASLTDKVVDVEKRLYSGSVSAIRELQAMQADVESLQRHRSQLEDQAFEAMEAREPLDAEVAGLDAEREALTARAGELGAALAAGEAAIDAELAVEEKARAEAAAGVPADLMADYERLRAKHGGVGVARLEGRSCLGCHLELPATEIDRIRRAAPDTVAHCDQCGRILVR